MKKKSEFLNIRIEFLGTLDSGENVKKFYHASLLCHRLFT